MTHEKLLLSFKTQEDYPLKFQEGLPANFQRYALPGARQYINQNNISSLLLQVIYQGDCQALLSHYLIKHPCTLKVTTHTSEPIIYYIVAGGFHYRYQQLMGLAVTGQANMITASVKDNELVFIRSGTYIVLSVIVPMKMLATYTDSFPIVTAIQQAVAESYPEPILRVNISAYQLLDSIVYDILEPKWNSTARIIQVRLKIFEFVTTILYLFSNYQETVNETTIKDTDKIKIVTEALQQYIHAPIPPRLKVLARLAAVTERKLEDIFRTVYDSSIRVYFNELRLKAMHHEIVTESISLKDIAIAYGYRDYSTFSAAIKRKFGKSPLELRLNATAK